MQINAFGVLLVVAAALFLLGIVLMIFASGGYSEQTEKKLYFVGSLGVAFASCLGGMAGLIGDWQLPVDRTEGVIIDSFTHAEGRGYRTELVVRSGSGKDFVINASGTSRFFHSGQRLDVKYQARTGHVIKATFLSSTGATEGVFNGTDTLWAYPAIGMSCFLVFAAYRKYRRSLPSAVNSSV